MARARILVADDHANMLERVARVLATDYDVVAALPDGVKAVDGVIKLQPDLAIFDISMPGLTGLEAAAKLAKGGRSVRVIFLTVHEDQEFVDAARSVGAFGYVLKRNILTDLLPVVRRALNGQTTFLAPLHAQPAPAPAAADK
jgi:DNA-binding NarL/FixJ family response regulator